MVSAGASRTPKSVALWRLLGLASEDQAKGAPLFGGQFVLMSGLPKIPVDLSAQV